MKKFLVEYYYGQGSVWLYMYAPTAEEIEREFPELRVVDTPPHWMDTEFLNGISGRAETLGGPYSGMLASLILDREK